MTRGKNGGGRDPLGGGGVLVWMMMMITVASSSVHAQLTYQITFRSFLPAGCARTYNDVNNAWTYANTVSPRSDPFGGSGKPFQAADYPTGAYFGSTSPPTLYTRCPIFDDTTYHGHPDFEASTAMYAEGCSGNFNPLVPKSDACSTTDDEAITKIVENNLTPHEDGLPKPVYCTSTPVAGDARCGWHKTFQSVSTTGKTNFDMWYRDNPNYNLRSGALLPLTVDSKTGNFQFKSSAFYPLASSGGFGLKPCQPTSHKLDCGNGGVAFPPALKDASEDSTRIWSFTSEIHTFFQLKGTEIFKFSGDDDVWVFLNEKLAVDVGGLHSQADSTIDLSNATVVSLLGMQIGGIYALDMYHAERHSTASNFQITTGLVGGCTVLQSGKPAYVWTPATLSTDFKIIGGPTWGLVQGSSIKLTDSAQQNTVGYAFLQQQINVGAGFVITFQFTASSKGEGFVFVLQRDTITNLNGGSGGNLGFKNTANSVGIAFDFCTDRETTPGNPACLSRETRMHFLRNGGVNDASDSTRVWRAKNYLPVVYNDGKTHTVTINYFAQSPPWFEVIVDNDLMMQDRNFSIEQVIGGRNAFAGFTASTGFTTSTITVTNLNINTVAIEDSRTKVVNLPDGPLNATADGRKFVEVQLQNLDFCNGTIQFGGFGDRAKGIATLVEGDTNSSVSRLLESGNVTLDGEIFDTNNGQYSVRFRTKVPGVYDISVYYGQGCFKGKNNTGDLITNAPTSTCFSFSKSRAAVFSPVPPTPTPAPDAPATGLGAAALTGIGVAAGIIGAVGSILLFVGIRFRNQWRRDKAFIDAGKAAVAERDVTYLGDGDLDALQQRLQATLHAIHAERAKKLREGDKQAIIDELNRQRGELQEQVRRLKIKLDGGDPNEPIPTLGTRIRKSFAATGRVSRGISMRLSRGFSLAQEGNTGRIDPYGGETSSSNPLFQRMSQAFLRKGAPPPIPEPRMPDL